MSGRVALVTGAARGIGAATVRRLVVGGDHVVAVDSCAGRRDRGRLSARHPESSTRSWRAAATEPLRTSRTSVTGPALQAAVDARARPMGTPRRRGRRRRGDRRRPAAVGDLGRRAETCCGTSTSVASGTPRPSTVPAMLAGPDPAGRPVRGRRLRCREPRPLRPGRLQRGQARRRRPREGTRGGPGRHRGHRVRRRRPGSTRTPMLDATAELYDLLGRRDFAEQPAPATADRPRRGRRHRCLLLQPRRRRPQRLGRPGRWRVLAVTTMATEQLPAGFEVRLRDDLIRADGGRVLVGGSPARAVRLSARAQRLGRRADRRRGRRVRPPRAPPARRQPGRPGPRRHRGRAVAT